MEGQRIKLKRLWEQRKRKEKRESGSKESGVEEEEELPQKLTMEEVSSHSVSTKSVVVLRFVDDSGTDIMEKINEATVVAMEAEIGAEKGSGRLTEGVRNAPLETSLEDRLKEEFML